jgi:hypothetical protein
MNVYCSLLSGQGDIKYIVMSECQWESIGEDVNVNELMLGSMTQDEYEDEKDNIDFVPFIVEFCDYQAKPFFEYLRKNEATVVDVHEGEIF